MLRQLKHGLGVNLRITSKECRMFITVMTHELSLPHNYELFDGIHATSSP